MPDVEIRLTDNSEETLKAFETNALAALEACGIQAASHAKQIVSGAGRVNTGAMMNSITSQVAGKEAYVGTNINYAQYHEMGTGVHIAGGRQSPWAYQGSDGEWHFTRGVPPLHMIKNAVADHTGEYRSIITEYLSRGG